MKILKDVLTIDSLEEFINDRIKFIYESHNKEFTHSWFRGHLVDVLTNVVKDIKAFDYVISIPESDNYNKNYVTETVTKFFSKSITNTEHVFNKDFRKYMGENILNPTVAKLHDELLLVFVAIRQFYNFN